MNDTKQAIQIALEKKRLAEKEISEFVIKKLAELTDDTGLSVHEVVIDVTVLEINRMGQEHPDYRVGGVKTEVKFDF